MNFLIFEVARLLAWPGYLPITLLYIEPYSLELNRSTCSCQHRPSLHSGIRQSLWREKVDVS